MKKFNAFLYTKGCALGYKQGENRRFSKNFHFAFAAKNGGYTWGVGLYTRRYSNIWCINRGGYTKIKEILKF